MTPDAFVQCLQDLAKEGQDANSIWATEVRDRGKIAVRICAKYTPPGDGKKTTKQAQMSLRRRILWNIMGDSGQPVRALIIKDRQGQLRQINRTGRGGVFPFVVPEARSATVTYTDPLQYLTKSGNTYFVRKKNDAMRFPKNWSTMYVKAPALKRAVRTLQSRAGYTIGGWATAAKYVGIANQSPYFPQFNAPGSARVECYGDVWYVDFENPAIDRFRERPARAQRVAALPDATYIEFTLACKKREKNIQRWMENKMKK